MCGESHGFSRELVRERLNESQCLAWVGSYDRDDSCCVGLVIVNEYGNEAQPAVRIYPEQLPFGVAGAAGLRGPLARYQGVRPF